MITAIFRQENNYHQFMIGGHANHAKKGQDVVCAYVSGLVIATVNEMNECGAIVVDGDTILTSFGVTDSGQLPVEYHLIRLYKLLKQNLQEIEQQYPDNIRVVIESE